MNVHSCLPTAGRSKNCTHQLLKGHERVDFSVSLNFFCLGNQLVENQLSQLVLFCLVPYPLLMLPSGKRCPKRSDRTIVLGAVSGAELQRVHN